MTTATPTASDLLTRPDPNDLLDRPAAAAYIGVKPQTLAVWKSTQRYNLPVIMVGRLARYRRRDLDAWLEARTVGTLED